MLEPQSWIAALETGGPWAIVVALAIAVIALARAYVNARDAKDAAQDVVSEKLIGLLTQVIQSSERQQASNERVAEILEKLERRLEAVAASRERGSA